MPSPARVMPIWSLVLPIVVVLAAGCTSPGQGQSNYQGQQQGPAQQGPSEGQGPSEVQGRGEPGFGLLGVGSHLPSDQECADRAQHDPNDQQEARPENTAANQFVPDRVLMPVWKNDHLIARKAHVDRVKAPADDVAALR